MSAAGPGRAGLRRGLRAALAALALGACAGAEVGPAREADEPEWLQRPLPREYVLEVGDVFDLKLFYHPELNEPGVVVRTDGHVSAQLVGEVPVRGRTVSALAADLTGRYEQAGLKRPSVTVILRKSAGLRVYVGGEVNNPGLVLHDGRLTLSRAILQAGGPKSTAEVRSVVLLRDPGSSDESPRFATLDLNRLIERGRDPVLQPYDVVVVPRSTISRMNQFVEQYFVKLIPVTLTAGFQYTLGTVRTPP